MYTELLIQAGLSQKEAAVYEQLLELGPSSVGRLIKSLPYKRGDLYNILYSLRDKGLLSEELKKGIMTFTLESPEKLQVLLASQKEKITTQEKALSDTFPQLKSLYNLSMNKPGVRFYEGKEGVWKTLEDSLSTTGEIYTYGDHDALNQYIPDLNKRYFRERAKKNIRQKMILLDSPNARSFLATHLREITETKLIPVPRDGLVATMMKVYDGRVSYFTFSESSLIGVIIEDKEIFRFHKLLFEYLWSISSPFCV